MDRRKFVLCSVAGSGALFSLTGRLLPSLSGLIARPGGQTLNQSDFEKMVIQAEKNQENLFLSPGTKVKLSRPTQINISINGQNSYFYLENNAKFLVGKGHSHDIHLRNFSISHDKKSDHLILIKNTQDIILENLNLLAEKANAIAIMDSQNIHLLGSRLHFAEETGVEINNSRDIYFQNNVFHAKENALEVQDYLRFNKAGEIHITDNLFKSKNIHTGVSFIGEPADDKSFIKNNRFLA